MKTGPWRKGHHKDMCVCEHVVVCLWVCVVRMPGECVCVCVCCVSSSSTSDSKIRSPCQRMQPEAWYCKHSAGGGDSHGPHLGAYRGSILSSNNIVLLHALRAIWISTTASYGFCRWFLATKPLRHRSTSTTCSMATGSASRKRGISDLLLGGRPLGDIIGSCNP